MPYIHIHTYIQACIERYTGRQAHIHPGGHTGIIRQRGIYTDKHAGRQAYLPSYRHIQAYIHTEWQGIPYIYTHTYIHP